jgi:hypothetical protein
LCSDITCAAVYWIVKSKDLNNGINNNKTNNNNNNNNAVAEAHDMWEMWSLRAMKAVG